VKRSEIDALVDYASACFSAHGWALPPEPRWDVTDFGLGDWRRNGLVLVNLAEEREYCEKLMYARAGMTTPVHCHARKKEDIICRWGSLAIRAWRGKPVDAPRPEFALRIDGKPRMVVPGATLVLPAGSRVTLEPGTFHCFVPASAECILGEVSTANDDTNDNLFADPEVGRFPGIDEDAPARHRLAWER
jgi:D-lyxose ketol-isomerase